MSQGAEPLVVIVHGAVARETTFVWMEQLRRHFLEHGIPRVELFPWSGRVGKRSLLMAGERFAAALESWLSLAESPSSERALPVRIYAKSVGALVVRRGVALLVEKYPGLRLEMLLQVASPNPPRTEESLRAFSRVVNLYSTSDSFLRFFIRIGLFWLHTQRLETEVTRVLNIEIGGTSHHAFNTNVAIGEGDLIGTRLFDYYHTLLSQQGSE
jgi:hypothetical protein